MPVTRASQESHSLIRLEGESNIASASELKEALLEGLAGGGELHVNLEQLTSLDLSAMQLIWSAGKEAERAGVKFVVALPEALSPAVRQAGFEQFPGLGKHSDPAIEE
ncbi:MAG TPA: STAS domain-containing protein [Bryobacteraceae bacterium]|nr:STAS domain-containing protein [Bryobacteraceae bacterium]